MNKETLLNKINELDEKLIEISNQSYQILLDTCKYFAEQGETKIVFLPEMCPVCIYAADNDFQECEITEINLNDDGSIDNFMLHGLDNDEFFPAALGDLEDPDYIDIAGSMLLQ